MKSLFLVRYKLTGRHEQILPVYCLSEFSAYAEIDRRLGANGLERNKYRITGHREISHEDFGHKLPGHRRYVSKLSTEEKDEFRRDRQNYLQKQKFQTRRRYEHSRTNSG